MSSYALEAKAIQSAREFMEKVEHCRQLYLHACMQYPNPLRRALGIHEIGYDGKPKLIASISKEGER